jgi:sporulation integral membrane protein YlbJ
LRVIVMRKMNMLSGAVFVGLFTVSLVVFPKEGVEAAMAGLRIFWEVVLPSMLPFFVLSEMMLGMGVVHFIGVLLEPLMRPLFNVPGVGAFALSLGLAAGYPMDAVITGKFRRSGMCSRVEGERLLSFTNTADPLFIFGAVAVGMFRRPELGAVLGITHYLSGLTVGCLFKYYRGGPKEPLIQEDRPAARDQIIRRAFRAMVKAREDDRRPIGKLMGDAVKESMGTLFMIGGFIMLFAVLVKMLAVLGVIRLVIPLIGAVLNLFGLDPHLAAAVFNGILEIDLGTVIAAGANAPLADRVIIAGWIIAWSGLCVHGQVASVIHDTDIRMGPYVVARMLHGIIAAVYIWLFMGPLAPVSLTVARALPVSPAFNPVDRVILSGRQILAVIALLLLGGILTVFFQHFAIVRAKRGNR